MIYITLDLTINESYDDVVDTMYRCRRQCIISWKLSDDKWSVCRYVTDVTGCDHALARR